VSQMLIRRPGIIILLSLFISVSTVPCSFADNKKIFLREDFNSLDSWRTVNVSNKPEHTKYTIEKTNDGSYLKAESNKSVLALAYKEEFNVYTYPKVRWRWKVNNVYQNANPETKDGDDYAIRVYVAFKYDPKASTSIGQRLKYGLVNSMYGEYPPQSTLNYVWANSENQKTILTSPYSDTIKLIALEKGSKKVGTWQDEEIDIIQDYKKAFGVDPPPIAGIAVMNDSDNTGQSSVSYIDFIEVYSISE
jgi:hypothetical protein